MTTQYLDTLIEIDDICRVYRGSFGLGGELSEPDIIEKVKDILEKIKDPIMLDIGACTGSYALLDKLVDVQIHSFEPVVKTFNVLKKNIKVNNSKTICYNYAVSNYNGSGVLKTVGHDGAIALSLVDGIPSFTRKHTIESKIKVVTIDSWCEDRNIIPDVIKIDVEGGELRVIEGAKKIIEKYTPVILCEYSQENANQFGNPIEDIIKLLQMYDIEYLKDNILCVKKSKWVK